MTASEISMSNPASGTLRLSSGLDIERCNPSFIWSDDSRFLAAPQWRYMLGLQLCKRIVLLDTAERLVYGSTALAKGGGQASVFRSQLETGRPSHGSGFTGVVGSGLRFPSSESHRPAVEELESAHEPGPGRNRD